MTEITEDQAPATTSTDQRAVVVPDKPALEGLEDKWSERWKDEDTYRFDRTQPRENVYSIDTPPPTVSGCLHVGHVFSYTHTDLIARFQRMRGQGGVLPDGLGRQRPADRAPRAELLRRPLRPDACPTTRTSPRRRSPTRRSRSRSAGPTSSSCASGSSSEDEKVFESLWRTLGLSVDWHEHYTTIGAQGPDASASARSCATSPAARPTSPRPRRCGTSPSRRRSRRPSSRPATTPAPTTGSPSTSPTVSRSTSRPRVPS